jgi:hypothetical protein
MEKFASRFCEDQPGCFKSVDTAYVLAYAVIMLNTDAHNHLAEHTMSRDSFIAMNVDGCPDEELDPEFLGGIFDRIQACEIEVHEVEDRKGAGGGGSGGGGGGSKGEGRRARLAASLAMLNPLSTRSAYRAAAKESEAVLASTVGLFQAQKSRHVSVYYAATHAAHARPMLEVVGHRTLAALRTALAAAEHAGAALLCLEAIAGLVRVAGAAHHLPLVTNGVAALVTASDLDVPRHLLTLKPVEALLMLLELAALEGHLIHDSWGIVLESLSHLDELGFFDKKPKPLEAALPNAVVAELRPEVVARVRVWMEEIGCEVVERVYTATETLDLESTLHFVRALCEVSAAELFPRDGILLPRCFSPPTLALYFMSSPHLSRHRLCSVVPRVP